MERRGMRTLGCSACLPLPLSTFPTFPTCGSFKDLVASWPAPDRGPSSSGFSKISQTNHCCVTLCQNRLLHLPPHPNGQCPNRNALFIKRLPSGAAAICWGDDGVPIPDLLHFNSYLGKEIPFSFNFSSFF